MKGLSEIDLISSEESCKLYKTPQTNVEADALRYVCSEQAGRIAFHRKLKLYKSGNSFYVIARGIKCHVGSLANKWFYK